jgi:membrane-associated phospholipid phosphatase
MNTIVSSSASPPPTNARASFWNARRRRPVFLLILGVGLILALLWLPANAWNAFWSALSAQQGLLVLIFLFALLTLSLVWSAGQRVDSWIFLFLNLHGYHPSWLDRIMRLATQLGNVLTALLFAGLSFLLRNNVLAIEMIVGTFTLLLLVETMKVATDRARPFLDLAEARIIGFRERGRSFPSGHTAQTFFLMTLFSHWFQIGLWGTIALYAIAALVGFTRIYVGAHYPRDVIGGAVLGSVWGILATLVDPYWLGRFG